MHTHADHSATAGRKGPQYHYIFSHMDTGGVSQTFTQTAKVAATLAQAVGKGNTR